MPNDHDNPEANISEMFRLAEEIRILGEDWADKLRAAQLLEETKTSVRAEIALRIRGTSNRMTRRDSEDAALLSEDYKQHVHAMVDAKHAANLARVRLEAARSQFDAMRTAEVSRRAEMNKYQPG
jgi:hypothetical protein